MGAKSLQFFLSGGAANNDPNQSLGGGISSTQIVGNLVNFDAAGISGVTLLDASGMASGVLQYNTSTPLGLAIKKMGGGDPGANEYVDVVAGGDGDYVLNTIEQDSFLAVSVVTASLPGVQSSDSFTAVQINPNLFANVSQTEANAGGEKYRHLYLYNPTGQVITCRGYIKSNYAGLDTLSMGFAHTTSGFIDQLLADEDTAPSGVVFDSPSSLAEAVSLTINPSSSLGLFLRRQVTALSDISLSADTAELVFELSV